MKTHNGVPRDEAWFEAFFKTHHAKIRAYALRRDPQAADDIVAQVFETAWRHRDRLPDHELPWLYRTASNHLLHSYRDSTRHMAREARFEAVELSSATTNPTEGIADRLDQVELIESVLAEMSESDAELLKLWAWEQLEIIEIAQVVGCSAATARVRLHRARKRCEILLNQKHAHTRAAELSEQGMQ